MPEVQSCSANGESLKLHPLKVRRISHSGSVAAYRERERQLLQQGRNIDLKLVVPEKWNHLGGSSITSEQFEIIPTRTYGTGSISLIAYDPAALSKSFDNLNRILSMFMRNHIRYRVMKSSA